MIEDRLALQSRLAAVAPRDALALATRLLGDAGVETPERDARLLLAGAEDAAEALSRRAAREPVSRILGRRGFWTLDLAIGPAVLDPRPDTETVVEAALDAVSRRRAGSPLRLLDLGTGSGCILLALLDALPDATGLGIDTSAAAIEVARANASRSVGDRAYFLVGNWADAIAGRFDLVVSNPPYIPTADIAALDPEVRLHDPRPALDGGIDGLDAYRAILAALPRLLAAEAVAVLELGAGQDAAVAAIAAAHGLEPVARRPDLAGILRAVVLRNA